MFWEVCIALIIVLAAAVAFLWTNHIGIFEKKSYCCGQTSVNTDPNGKETSGQWMDIGDTCINSTKFKHYEKTLKDHLRITSPKCHMSKSRKNACVLDTGGDIASVMRVASIQRQYKDCHDASSCENKWAYTIYDMPHTGYPACTSLETRSDLYPCYVDTTATDFSADCNNFGRLPLFGATGVGSDNKQVCSPVSLAIS